MDKLSEHAIRMLEIEGKGKNDGYIETRNMGDIARAVYDLILQVQMLKEVSRKKNSSEKPNNCEDSQDWKDRMWTEAMRSCGFNVDGYRQGQPKDEPTISKMEQVDKDINVRSKEGE